MDRIDVVQRGRWNQSVRKLLKMKNISAVKNIILTYNLKPNFTNLTNCEWIDKTRMVDHVPTIPGKHPSVRRLGDHVFKRLQ